MLAAVQVVKNSIWVLMGGRKRGHQGCREPLTQNGKETPTWMGEGGKRLAEEETQELEERNTHGRGERGRDRERRH